MVTYLKGEWSRLAFQDECLSNTKIPDPCIAAMKGLRMWVHLKQWNGIERAVKAQWVNFVTTGGLLKTRYLPFMTLKDTDTLSLHGDKTHLCTHVKSEWNTFKENYSSCPIHFSLYALPSTLPREDSAQTLLSSHRLLDGALVTTFTLVYVCIWKTFWLRVLDKYVL